MTGSLTRASRGAARGPNLRRFELLLPRSCPRLAVGEEGEEGDEGVVAVVQKTMDSTSTNKWPIAVGSEHRLMNLITAPCLGIGRFLHRGADLSKIHLKRQIESESYEAGSVVSTSTQSTYRKVHSFMPPRTKSNTASGNVTTPSAGPSGLAAMVLSAKISSLIKSGRCA